MNTTAPTPAPVNRPWHRWLVAVLVFGSHLGGLRDYWLIMARDTTYIQRQFGAGGLSYFLTYPWPLRTLWTINIASGLLAPIAMLIRVRWGLVIGLVAAVSQGLLMAITFATRHRWQRLGAATSLFDLGVELITVAFVVYCWAQQRRTP